MLRLYEELSGTSENFLFTPRHAGVYSAILPSGARLSSVFSAGKKSAVLSFIDIGSYAVTAVDNWITRMRTFCTFDIQQNHFFGIVLFRYGDGIIYNPPFEDEYESWLTSMAGSGWGTSGNGNYIPFTVLRNDDWVVDCPPDLFLKNTNLSSPVSVPFTYILTPPRTGAVARVHDKFYPECVNNGRTADTATLPSRLKLDGWWHATDASVNEDKCIEYLTKRLEDVEAEAQTVTVLPAFAPASESATRLCPDSKIRLEFSEKAVKPEQEAMYTLGTAPGAETAFSSVERLKLDTDGTLIVDPDQEELLFSLYNAGEKEIWEGTVGTLTLAPGVHPFNLNTALVDGSGLPFALISPGTGLARYNYVAAPAPEDAPTAEIVFEDGTETPVTLDGVGATPRFNQSERTLSIEIETGFPAFDEPTGTLTRPGGLPSVPLAFTNRAVSVDKTVLSANGQYTVTVDSYTNNAGQNMTAVSRSFIIDTTAPTITIESPLSTSTVTDSTVMCHYSEDLSEGSIRWTRTGGTADSGSPHTFTIPAGGLPAAGFDDTTVPGLVDGAVYSLTVSGKDLAGNDAVSAVHTNITFSTSVIQPAPGVTNITSTTANGSYNAGDHIDVRVTFDRAVTVTYPPGSAPTLALNSGGTATYTGGSGTVTLTFNYLVASGENTPDLDSATGAAMNENGATIQAVDDGQPANLAVPVKPTAGALAVNKAIIIDTAAPGISFDAPPSNSTVMDSTVTCHYSEDLSEGTITWTRTGGTADGGSPHDFTIPAGGLPATGFSGNTVSGLIDGAVYTVAVNSKDLAGNAAQAVHTNITFSTSITQPAPKVTNITSTTANGSYKKDAVIDIQVTFDRAVTVTCPPGTAPTLALNSGGTATYTGGSGTATLNFEYVVASGENTADLDSAYVSALKANGATIQAVDDARAANLAVPVKPTVGALAVNKAIIIDTSTSSGGDPVPVRLAPSAPVKVAGGIYVNSKDVLASVSIRVPLGNSGSIAGDELELLINTKAFVPEQLHILTSDEIAANEYTFMVPGTAFGNNGEKIITARIKVSTDNYSPDSAPLTLYVDTLKPTVETCEFR